MKKYGIYTLDAIRAQGKTVLLRVDINEPIDKVNEKICDDTRIRGCIPTIRELKDQGARVVVLAHQGSDIEYHNFYSLRLHAEVLSAMLGFQVQFIPDVCGPAAQQAICQMKDGEVLLLENVRFMAEEQTLFEHSLKLTHAQQADTQVVRALAPLADFYVCDAFAAAHRSQPTLCAFEQRLPSAMGRLFEKEYEIVSQLMQSPKRPCLFILGGAKIADAFEMMHTVLERNIADGVLTGGLVANILLTAKGETIGEASLDFIKGQGYGRFIETAASLLALYGKRIHLPLDLAYVQDEKRCEAEISALPDRFMLVDIGKQTADAYVAEIKQAKTIFVNGPMGIFEKPETEYGTETIWRALADASAYTVIGGGDSVTATNQYHLANQMGYICTGGGALMRLLAGEELPAIKALRYAAEQFCLE